MVLASRKVRYAPSSLTWVDQRFDFKERLHCTRDASRDNERGDRPADQRIRPGIVS